MKFKEDNVIQIKHPDSKVKALCYVIGTLLGIGLLGLCFYIAVVGKDILTTLLESLGSAIGGIILFAICATIGDRFYQHLPTYADVKIPLSDHIVVRREGSHLLALYYKRWGSYRRWGIKHIESLEEKDLNEEVAQYKNDYRLAYTNRHEKPPKVDANRILYEGKL